MKILKEIRQPDLIKRRQILTNLAQIQPYPDLKDLKRQFRTQLRATFGYTLYFFYYKGVKFFIGNESTPNKYMYNSLDERILIDQLKKYRQSIKKNNFMPKVFSFDNYRFQYNYNPPIGLWKPSGEILQIAKRLHTYQARTPKKPTTKDSYIGIELEYASSLSHDEIATKIADLNLHKKLRVMNDSSITTLPTHPFQIELCFLTKMSDLDKDLEILKQLIGTNDEFIPNPSCGLHVHLDARNGDVKKMFHNLVCMQTLLFGMASEFRRDNRYCRPLNTANFDEVDHKSLESHYDAISKSSYFKHKTIEIRIHQSTCDLTLVSKWVKLLKKIADYQGSDLEFGSMGTTLNQVEKLKLSEELTTYIKEKSAV